MILIADDCDPKIYMLIHLMIPNWNCDENGWSSPPWMALHSNRGVGRLNDLSSKLKHGLYIQTGGVGPFQSRLR